ncbi:hypothetical protein [Marinicella meishanensis]|uniref:hypothetical protein n=1 Tax=Marinicella meishanensis TaxID=2873263 RepID=UPI001CBF7C71|nr:hypothetical protein [Marinicella sp. NBU2979]
MEATAFYSEYLSLFLSLVIAGTGLKLAIQKHDPKTYQVGDKSFSRQKVHTTATLLFLGVVIQLVANAMANLDGRELLLDEKVIGAYAFSLAVLIFKN